MNSQPFDTFESPPATAVDPHPFFDRAGLAWMAACVAIAVAAGHWIPRLTEPGAWGHVAQATNPATAASAAAKTAKFLPPARPLHVAGEEAQPAKTAGKLQLGMF